MTLLLKRAYVLFGAFGTPKNVSASRLRGNTLLFRVKKIKTSENIHDCPTTARKKRQRFLKAMKVMDK